MGPFHVRGACGSSRALCPFHSGSQILSYLVRVHDSRRASRRLSIGAPRSVFRSPGVSAFHSSGCGWAWAAGAVRAAREGRGCARREGGPSAKSKKNRDRRKPENFFSSVELTTCLFQGKVGLKFWGVVHLVVIQLSQLLAPVVETSTWLLRKRSIANNSP